MMDDSLRELYQEMILGHNKNPKNKGRLESPDVTKEGFNPLCGDQITLDVQFDGDVVANLAFDGHGCAIDTASASMMTEAVKGKTREDAIAIAQAFAHMVLRDEEADTELLGKLTVFEGVGEFPARVKCATLPWRTLELALVGGAETASTE